MPTLTLTIPEEVKLALKKAAWVNWSEVAREELIREQERLEAYERFKKIVSKSKFTEEDAEELADKINKSMHASLKAKGLV